MAENIGKVVQVSGPAVDVQFEEAKMPSIYQALRVVSDGFDVPSPVNVILEVQQTSDTTYRLYDHGRPRELHLEDGMKVIKIENGSGKVAAREVGGCTELIAAKYFVVERCEGGGRSMQGAGLPECVVGLEGACVVVRGKTRVELPVGQAVVIPACCGEYSVEGDGSFVRARVPSRG